LHPYLVPRRRTGSRRKTFSEGVPGARLRRDSRKLPTQPASQNPAYTEDAAEAVAWTFENIEEFGGDKDKIYIAGHSAGGYLCLMLNLDKSYLAKWNIDANSLAGAFPISGQTTTHYTIRKERGLPSDTPIIDKYAPSNNVRKDASPMILITGDKELECWHAMRKTPIYMPSSKHWDKKPPSIRWRDLTRYGGRSRMYLDKQLYEEGRQEVTTTLAFLLRMPMPLLLLFYIQHRAVYENVHDRWLPF